MPTREETFEMVKIGRAKLGSTLKKDFYDILSECPCCKAESSCITITFWFGSWAFSVGNPKWSIQCNACEFRANFWASTAKKATVKFQESFREAVALRLMGKKKKRRKKKVKEIL